MFTIPDKGEGQNDIQSILFQEYLDILVAGIAGTDCVMSGCAVTAQGSPNMTVAVASGVVRSNGAQFAVTGANGTITTAHATLPRLDLVVITSAGAIAVRAGTAATAPKPPARTANDVGLAVVYVPAADTTISAAQITSLRTVSAGVAGITNVAVLTGNSAAANGAIIAAAMAAATEGSTLQFPEGLFNTTTITLDKVFLLRGVGRRATKLYAPSGDLLNITQTGGFGMKFKSLSMTSETGHVINQPNNLACGTMEDCYLNSIASGKSCWNATNTALMFDFEVYNCWFVQDSTTSGPLVKWVASAGNINSNTFRRCRFDSASTTSPAVYIECTGAGDYIYDINFYDMNFETADYGMIHAFGVQNMIISGVRGYDTSTYQDDVFKFGQTTGEMAKGITLIGSGRVSGALAGGKYDINTGGAIDVVSINSISNGGLPVVSQRITEIQGGKIITEYNIVNNLLRVDDADANLRHYSTDTILYHTTLTANRTVTPILTGMINGARFRIVRATSSGGAFNLFIGTAGALATLSAPGWVELAYSYNFGDFYVAAQGTFTGADLQQSIVFNATTMTVDFALGAEVTFGALTANVTAMSAPSNIPPSGKLCRFYMLQDATGGRTFTWHSKFTGTTWPVGSGTANQRQMVTGVSNGTNIVFQSASGWFTPT